MRVGLFTWTESSTSDHTNLHWRNLTCLDTTIRFSVTQQLTRVRLVLGETATAAVSYRFCSLLLWKEFLGASKRWGGWHVCGLRIIVSAFCRSRWPHWVKTSSFHGGGLQLSVKWLGGKVWGYGSWNCGGPTLGLGSQVEKFKYLGSYSWVGGEWSHRLMDELEWWGCCTSLW